MPNERTTLPRYLRTSSGWFSTASEMEQKMTPWSESSFLKVVAMLLESNTASTATFVSRFCSFRGTPSRSKVFSSSGSTCSAWSFSLVPCCAMVDHTIDYQALMHAYM